MADLWKVQHGLHLARSLDTTFIDIAKVRKRLLRILHKYQVTRSQLETAITMPYSYPTVVESFRQYLADLSTITDSFGVAMVDLQHNISDLGGLLVKLNGGMRPAFNAHMRARTDPLNPNNIRLRLASNPYLDVRGGPSDDPEEITMTIYRDKNNYGQRVITPPPE